MNILIAIAWIIAGIIAIVLAWYLVKMTYRLIMALCHAPGHGWRLWSLYRINRLAFDDTIPVRLQINGSEYYGEPKRAVFLRELYNKYMLRAAPDWLWKTWDELIAEHGEDSAIKRLDSLHANFERHAAMALVEFDKAESIVAKERAKNRAAINKKIQLALVALILVMIRSMFKSPARSRR